MPVLPKDDIEGHGVRTRSQRQLEVDVRRMESSPSRLSHQVPEEMSELTAETSGVEEMMEPTAGTSGVVPTAGVQVPASVDFGAMMAMLQEQVRRQEVQARLMEEQAHRQEEQVRRQEVQARLMEEQARRQEEQTCLMKNLQASFDKDLQGMKERVQNHEDRIYETETQITDIKKTLGVLKSGTGNVTSVVATPAGKGFKVPPYDGTSSWSAYKIQLGHVVKANGWTTDQAMTALTLALRDQALNVLEAIGNDATYEQLLEALESRYGDTHLEYVFRAQIRDRTQRTSENLQQWAIEAEKMVRKAYQSTPAVIDGILVQTFVDGIRDLEVRAAVRLGHHESLKNALAHALEVEAVRYDHKAHRIREVVTSQIYENPSRCSPKCYECGEKGHLRPDCPRKITDSSPKVLISRVHDGNSLGLIIKGEINGLPCKMIVDTGATRTVVSSRLAHRFLGNGSVSCKQIQLMTVTGQDISVQGEKQVKMKLGERTYQQDAIVADIIDDCILGLDFMRQHYCEIDLNHGILKCGPEKIVMEKGSFNSGADMLSKRTCPENWRQRVEQEPKDAVPIRTLRTGVNWKETLQQAQHEDTDIQPIVKWLTSGTPKPNETAKMSTATRNYWAQWDSLVIHDGMLCRKWLDGQGNRSRLQMIIPKVKVPEVLQLCHEESTEDHLGVKRTLAKIRERFYWVHCKNDVKEWCRKCASCLAVKELKTRSGEMLKTDRIQRDHVDRVAPGTMV